MLPSVLRHTCLHILLDRIQRVINCSAHLIFKTPKSAHVTPFLYDHHCLPISSRIQEKIALSCFQTVNGTAPPYLSELLHLYSPSCFFCSASDTRIFHVPRMGRRTLGKRFFQYIGTLIWNSLPATVRHSSSLCSFKSKTENPSLLFCVLVCCFLLIAPTHRQ